MNSSSFFNSYEDNLESQSFFSKVSGTKCFQYLSKFWNHKIATKQHSVRKYLTTSFKNLESEEKNGEIKFIFKTQIIPSQDFLYFVKNVESQKRINSNTSSKHIRNYPFSGLVHHPCAKSPENIFVSKDEVSYICIA